MLLFTLEHRLDIISQGIEAIIMNTVPLVSTSVRLWLSPWPGCLRYARHLRMPMSLLKMNAQKALRVPVALRLAFACPSTTSKAAVPEWKAATTANIGIASLMVGLLAVRGQQRMVPQMRLYRVHDCHVLVLVGARHLRSLGLHMKQIRIVANVTEVLQVLFFWQALVSTCGCCAHIRAWPCAIWAWP